MPTTGKCLVPSQPPLATAGVTDGRHSLACDPKQPAVLLNRAAAQLKLADHPAAVRDASVALVLMASVVDPQKRKSLKTKALFRRGQAFTAQGKHAEAAQDYERALELEPENERLQAALDSRASEELPPPVEAEKEEEESEAEEEGSKMSNLESRLQQRRAHQKRAH